MALVYFSDIDGGIHAIPAELTHFQPNDEADPYKMDKLMTIKYASGFEKQFEVTAEYFDTLLEYADETAPTFPRFRHRGLEMGEFVRHIGTKKAVPVIVNYMLHSFTMDGAVLDVLCCAKNDGTPVTIKYTADDKDWVYERYRDYPFAIHYDTTSSQGVFKPASPEAYQSIVIQIVDKCTHVHEIIAYVLTCTNKTYASRLSVVTSAIERILRDINPIHRVYATRCMMLRFPEIPRSVLSFWAAAKTA